MAPTTTSTLGNRVVKLLEATSQFLLLLLPTLPALAVLFAIKHSSPLPDLDYWYTLERFTNDNGLAINARFLTLHSNEHLVPVTGLLYVLNILLFSGSNIGLSLITWTMGVIQAFFLAALLPPQCRTTPTIKKLWWLVVSLFVFTPVAHHNWTHGMSGASWITANTFTVIALYFLIECDNKFSWRSAIASAGSGVLAATSYSTGLMAWPILALGGLVMLRRGQWRPFVLFTAAVIPVILLAVLTFERPSHRGPPTVDISLAQHGKFFVSLLGGTFDSKNAGLIALALCALLIIRLITYRKGELLAAAWPWVLLSTYPITNALISAVFRSDQFMSAASASRYGALPSLFILSVVLLLVASFSPRARMSSLAVVILAIGLGVFPYSHFRPEIKNQFVYQETKALAGLSLALDAPDKQFVLRTTMRDYARFLNMIPRLKLMQHVPFDSSYTACPRRGDIIGIDEKLTQNPDLVTDVRSIVIARGENEAVNLRVFARTSRRKAKRSKCLILIDGENRVIGRVIETRLPLKGTNSEFDGKTRTRLGGYLINHNVTNPVRLVFLAGQDGKTKPIGITSEFLVSPPEK